MARRIHDFRWFQVCWLPKYGWIMRRGPAVVVVPVASDGKVWLERIHRPPTGIVSWEVPGGEVGPREDPVDAALRELSEECGLGASGARLLSPTLELASGMGSFPHHVVVARDVAPLGRRPVAQREEGIDRVQRFDRRRIRQMIKRGLVVMQPTISAITLWDCWEG